MRSFDPVCFAGQIFRGVTPWQYGDPKAFFAAKSWNLFAQKSSDVEPEDEPCDTKNTRYFIASFFWIWKSFPNDSVQWIFFFVWQISLSRWHNVEFIKKKRKRKKVPLKGFFFPDFIFVLEGSANCALQWLASHPTGKPVDSKLKLQSSRLKLVKQKGLSPEANLNPGLGSYMLQKMHGKHRRGGIGTASTTRIDLSGAAQRNAHGSPTALWSSREMLPLPRSLFPGFCATTAR